MHTAGVIIPIIWNLVVFVCLSVAFLCLPLITVTLVRHVSSKKTIMCSQFEERHEILLMAFPRHGTRLHSEMNVKTMLQLTTYICW
jgi:hypothetical protein